MIYPPTPHCPMGYKKTCGRKSGSFVRLWSSMDPLPSSAPPLRPMMSIHQTVHPFLFTSATPIQPPPSSFFFHYTFNNPPHTTTTLPPLTYPHLSFLPYHLFACSTHSFHPLFCQKPSFHFLYSSPRSIISPHMSASSLFFVTHFQYPHLFLHPPIVSLSPIFSSFCFSLPYFSLPVCFIKIFWLA